MDSDGNVGGESHADWVQKYVFRRRLLAPRHYRIFLDCIAVSGRGVDFSPNLLGSCALIRCPRTLFHPPFFHLPLICPKIHQGEGVDSAVSGPRLNVRRRWVKEIFLAEKPRLVVIYIRLLTFHLDKTWRLFLSKNNKWQKQMLKKKRKNTKKEITHWG